MRKSAEVEPVRELRSAHAKAFVASSEHTKRIARFDRPSRRDQQPYAASIMPPHTRRRARIRSALPNQRPVRKPASIEAFKSSCSERAWPENAHDHATCMKAGAIQINPATRVANIRIAITMIDPANRTLEIGLEAD